MPEQASPHPSTVFLVHGRNLALANAVSELLRYLGVRVLDFSEVRNSPDFTGRYVGDVLDHAFTVAHSIVVLLSGDDEVAVRPGLRLAEDPRLRTEYQPRPNVLIELGMALRSHASRVVILEFPPLRRASDLAGLTTVLYRGDLPAFASDLAAKLRQAGSIVAGLPSAPPPTSILRAISSSLVGRLSHFARLGVALVAVSGISVGLTATLLRQPPICDASCQNAHRHWGQAHALWNEANSSGGDDRLYSKALEQFQHAYREQSRNLRYSASVGATLNDLGRHQSAIDLLLPISRTSWFAANTDKENKPWFLAELAAAYELIGNTVERDKYLQAATAQSPNLDAWYGNTISRYNQQDAKRLK